MLYLLLIAYSTDVILITLFAISIIWVKRNFIVSSMLLCMAILIHEMAILFFAPILGCFVLYTTKSIRQTILFSIPPLLVISAVLIFGFSPKGDLINSIDYDWINTGSPRVFYYTLQSQPDIITQSINNIIPHLFYTMAGQTILLGAIYWLFLKSNNLHKTLFSLAPFVAIAIFPLALDWGRFMALIQLNILIRGWHR